MRVAMDWWKDDGKRKKVTVVLDGYPEQVKEIEKDITQYLEKKGYELQ